MKKADIIVIAGQSNAVGCSEVRCLPKHFPANRIKKWSDGYENIKINYFSHNKKSGGFVKTAFYCTALDEDTFGPEVGIAEALDEKYPGKEFFIVKCAFGGVTLYHDFFSPSCGGKYDPGSTADETGSSAPGGCYNELVKIVSESLDLLKKSGYEPEIKAFCWMQGESDANNEDATAAYERNYGALLHDIKTRFSGYADGCRFIDAGISTVWERYERINEIKREYAETHADCVFIDTIGEGLTTMSEPFEQPDIGHYDSDSMIKLGRLFSEGFPPFDN